MSNPSIRRTLILAFMIISSFLYSCKPNDSKIQEQATANATAIDPGVTVMVKDGVATLSGTVADQATQESVASSVKEVKGVKEVINNTTVAAAPVEISADSQIKSDIENNFVQKGVRGVTFTVENGVVTLTGNVARNDLQKVMQAANEAKPKQVINKLTITD